MKVRVCYGVSGRVHVISLIEAYRLPGETDAQFFAREQAKNSDIAGLPFDDVDHTALPASREFRDAWVGSKGQAVSVDPVKKAEIEAERAAVDG